MASGSPQGIPHHRVKDLLNDALDLPQPGREVFLREACQGDDGLFQEVMSLLPFGDMNADVLERTAGWHPLSDDPDPLDPEGLEGSEVGPYRLARLLGSGGMGLVYLADRLGDVEGKVALKLIKRGMDSTAVEERFRQERQVLARLSHPNIAHFIDGGLSDEGRPFFVMQYVKGEPISRFVKSRKLSIEARVRLFLNVLDAVDYAHQNLVVHRDLKPSNIFVTETGVPKLLDFGVAKVMEAGEDGGLHLTRLGSRILTPSYSSPEQIRGDPLTTATDIYSLGVVLYEILTGRRPFELDRSPLHEVREVVSHRMPTRPSMSLGPTECTKDPGPRRLRRQIAGDLDSIVLKALRKEPEARYGSVREFHADLCRYLDGRPVLARRGSGAYRARKFLSRHRLAVAVTFAVTVVGGLGGGLLLRQRGQTAQQRLLAEQRVESVRSLVNTLAFEVHDEVARLAGSTGARQLILDRAFEQLETVRLGVPEDPDLLMSLAGIYQRLGDVQGNPSGPNLGNLSAASVSYSEGLELAQRSIDLDPKGVVRSRGLGILHERYGTTLASSGEIAEGLKELRAAQEVYTSIATAFPDSVRHQLTYVIGLVNLSDYQGHPSFPNLGNTEEAVAGYRDAAARLDSGILKGDSSLNVLRFRGVVQERLGRMLRIDGDLVRALAAEEGSLAVRRALYEKDPSDNDIQRDVGVSYQNVCSVKVMMNRAEEARVMCDLAVALFEERFREDSLNVGNLKDMTLIHRTYEELYLSAGDTARALEHIAQAVAWADRRLVLDSGSLLPRLDRVDALLTRALIQATRGKPVTGFREIQRSVEELRKEGHLSEFHQDQFRQLRSYISPN